MAFRAGRRQRRRPDDRRTARRRRVRWRHRQAREGRGRALGDAGREKRAGGVRLRVPGRLRRAHRELRPDVRESSVRYNPEGDRELNRRQARRLRRLSEWLHERERKLLFELLIPPNAKQLERVEGDSDRYDLEIRPALLIDTTRELQDAGVEPDIWKIEGLDRREDCERVAEQTRADGRDGVACIVLGRGADESRVMHWLEQGAGVPGYIGFAVGRTLWWDELSDYVSGRLGRKQAAERIAANYERMIWAYRRAEQDRTPLRAQST